MSGSVSYILLIGSNFPIAAALRKDREAQLAVQQQQQSAASPESASDSRALALAKSPSLNGYHHSSNNNFYEQPPPPLHHVHHHVHHHLHHHVHHFDRSSNGSPPNESSPSGASAAHLASLSAAIETLLEGDLILQALNGFLLILTCEGEVFYTSHTVETYLGFHQVRKRRKMQT